MGKGHLSGKGGKIYGKMVNHSFFHGQIHQKLWKKAASMVDLPMKNGEVPQKTIGLPEGNHINMDYTFW